LINKNLYSIVRFSEILTSQGFSSIFQRFNQKRFSIIKKSISSLRLLSIQSKFTLKLILNVYKTVFEIYNKK